jgi:hypothetical protein
METLLGVTYLARKGDYMYNFDLDDGFYTMGINLADRDYITVYVHGHLYRLAGYLWGGPYPPSIAR